MKQSENTQTVYLKKEKRKKNNNLVHKHTQKL